MGVLKSLLGSALTIIEVHFPSLETHFLITKATHFPSLETHFLITKATRV